MFPDERTIQIMMGQAWNLAAEIVAAINIKDIAESIAKNDSKQEIKEIQRKQLEDWQQYFFDQLMLPYKPLLEARAETEKALNLKLRKKEIKETKGDEEINYEPNEND